MLNRLALVNINYVHLCSVILFLITSLQGCEHSIAVH